MAGMFSLSVRLLDGSCRVVELRPDSTLAELRVGLERDLSVTPLHEMRLLQDMRELNDSAKIQVEVQALIVPSLPKAVQTLEKILVYPASTQEGLSQQKDWDAAVALLDEAQEVPTHLAERLLTMVLVPDGRCPHCLLEQVGAVFGRVCGNPEPFIERLVAGIAGLGIAALAEIAAQGRACGNPEPFIERLVAGTRQGLARLAALAEIAARCKHTLHGHTDAILEVCELFLEYYDDPMKELFLCSVVCRLLGHLGDVRHAPLLMQARDRARRRSFNRVADEADAAIEQINAREEMNAQTMSELAIKNTFLCAPREPAILHARAKSAPP